MYIPEQFREERPEVLRAFIAQHSLGALVAPTAEGLTANHVPMLWCERKGAPGVLRGHLARANPLWKMLSPDTPVLVIFGGANCYISPSWYPGKQEHGKVVPTWNYSVVHAHGAMRFLDDHDHGLDHVRELTDHHEGSRPEPWKVSDAPVDFIEPMLSRIIPFEITVMRLIGKFKASQHRPDGEREAVVAALAAEGMSASDLDEVIRAPAQR